MEFGRRKIWTTTYPVLISLFIQQIIGMTDTAFLGHVGEIELGASALGGIYYLVIYMIGFGFSLGAEILMARRNGEQNYRAIGRIFYHSAVVLIGLALLMFTFSTLLSPYILRHIISSDQIFDATMTFTRWRSAGFFFSFLFIVFRAFFMSTTNTRILTLTSIVMVLTNVVLNYALIFGKFGMPELGIAGSAIASSVSEFIALAFVVVYTVTRTGHRKYALFRMYRFSARILRQLFNVSIWTMIQHFISCGTWMFFFIATEHLGETSLAISNIVRNIANLLYLVVAAFSATGLAMVGNMMGRGEQDKILPFCRKLIGMCTLAVLPVFIAILIFPNAIMGIFTDNGDLIARALPSLRIVMGAYIFGVPAFILFAAVSGTGNTRKALYIELVALATYSTYIYVAAFVMHADVAICWISEGLYDLVVLIVSLTYMLGGKWKTKRI